MEALWHNHGIAEHDDPDEDWGELNVSFHGSAEYYFERRTVWERIVATNSGSVADN
jgi:hypothetical protein